MLVCHRCDVRACVRPDHLFLGSYADNAQDMAQKARHRPGRLTDEQVREIRRRAADGESQEALGNRFGLTQSHISLVAGRRRYRHVA